MAKTRTSENEKLLESALQEEVRRFRSAESAVLKDEAPGAAHDMLVAGDRLQELLHAVFPNSKTARKLLRDINKLHRAESEVRDMDAAIRRLKKRQGGAPEPDLREGLDLMMAWILSRRKKAHAALCQSLSRAGTSNVKARLKTLTAGIGKSGVDGKALADRISTALDDREQAFGKAMVRAHEAHPEDLSAARSAAGHLLRALEIAQQLGTGGSKAQIREVKAIEQHLENWHDLGVLESRIIGFCSKKRRIREHTNELRALYGLILDERTSKTRSVDAFLKAVEKFQTGTGGGG